MDVPRNVTLFESVLSDVRLCLKRLTQNKEVGLVSPAVHRFSSVRAVASDGAQGAYGERGEINAETLKSELCPRLHPLLTPKWRMKCSVSAERSRQRLRTESILGGMTNTKGSALDAL